MSFTYNDNVPATNNNPSFDQPKMLENTISIEQIWEVDHLTFSSNPAGTHKQLTFHQFASPAVPGAGQPSVVYPGTSANQVDMAHAQLYFQHELATFLLSAIRAFGSFSFTDGATTFVNSYNCASLTVTTSPRLATVTLNTNCTSGTSFVVVPFINGGDTLTYTIAANTVQFTTGTGGVNKVVSFIVLQV